MESDGGRKPEVQRVYDVREDEKNAFAIAFVLITIPALIAIVFLAAHPIVALIIGVVVAVFVVFGIIGRISQRKAGKASR